MRLRTGPSLRDARTTRRHRLAPRLVPRHERPQTFAGPRTSDALTICDYGQRSHLAGYRPIRRNRRFIGHVTECPIGLFVGLSINGAAPRFAAASATSISYTPCALEHEAPRERKAVTRPKDALQKSLAVATMAFALAGA